MKLFPHGSQTAAENSAQRAVAEAERVFDAAIIHLFEITQRKRGTMKFWQSGKCRIQPLIYSSCVDRFVFAYPLARVGKRSAFSQKIMCPVSRNGCQPGGKFLRIAHAPACL